MAARIHRYEVPVDDDWHPIDLYGEIVHVAARTPHAVELWAWDRRGVNAETRMLRAFATDKGITDAIGGDAFRHVDTAVCEDGRRVWHLIESVADDPTHHHR